MTDNFLLSLILIWAILCISHCKKQNDSEKIGEIHSITKTDTSILANIIFSECSICPPIEKLATGSVVLNRIKDGRWGCTIEDVVYYPNQFHGTGGNWQTNKECMDIARYLLINGSVDPEPLYFFQTYRKEFTKNLTTLYKLKYHYFAK